MRTSDFAILLHWARSKTVKLSDCKLSDINALLQLADQLLFQDITKQLISYLCTIAKRKNEDNLNDIAIDLLVTVTERRMTALHDVLIRYINARKEELLTPKNFTLFTKLPPSVLVHILMAKEHSYCSCVSCNLVKN